MQTRSRISALSIGSALFAAVATAVASISANTFSDPSALALQRHRGLQKLADPSPISCPVLLRDKVFRSGARAHLKKARRDYFIGLIQLGGTPAWRGDDGKSAVMNRAARRAAARELRYFPS